MEPKTIIFIGPQASGKGTQVERLIDVLGAQPGANVLRLQTGDAFRKMVSEGGFTGRRIEETINNGRLVPQALTNALVAKELMERLAEDTTLVLDGYPRNLSQAETLEELLAFYDRNALSVIFLDTPDAVVKERMLGRGRADDTEAAIAERLRLYHEATSPLLNYYRNRPHTNFVQVNGAQSIDQVSADILTGLSLT